MKNGPDISSIASLLGDPARANILLALMSGKALTATELSREAGITASTTSSHLSKLLQAEFITVRSQGRHRFYAIADDDVAELIETMIGFAASRGALRFQPGPKDPLLRKARVCYSHLAGELGVQAFESMRAKGLLKHEEDQLLLTDAGQKFCAELGMPPSSYQGNTPSICKPCLDWSERRSHMAGKLGKALLMSVLERGWAKRHKDSRIIEFSPQGLVAFNKIFSA